VFLSQHKAHEAELKLANRSHYSDFGVVVVAKQIRQNVGRQEDGVRIVDVTSLGSGRSGVKAFQLWNKASGSTSPDEGQRKDIL
jgi:hypothetical protein